MSDRGKFSGFCWHQEYHTINRKKPKAADCIYLTEDRICRNSKCVQYGDKCFAATYCTYRIREKKTGAPSENSETEKRDVKINCTIPKGAALYHQTYGEGHFLAFQSEFRIISVRFGTEVKNFQYPEAFIEGHVRALGKVYQCVQEDIQNAIRE